MDKNKYYKWEIKQYYDFKTPSLVWMHLDYEVQVERISDSDYTEEFKSVYGNAGFSAPLLLIFSCISLFLHIRVYFRIALVFKNMGSIYQSVTATSDVTRDDL